MNVCVITPREIYTQLAQGVEGGVVEAFSAIFEEVAPCSEDHYNGAGCDGVVGIISFVGTVYWSLIIAFPRATAMAMAEKFVGAQIPFEGEDMIDLTGELVNIAAGPICAHLIPAGIEAKMSLPTVARGEGVEVILPGHMAERLHFTSAQGLFRAKIVAAPAR